MSGGLKIVERPKKVLAMHPKKFAMWLFILSVTMLFASLTSAYIVRRAEGNWDSFELPWLFYFSSGCILLSSISMQWVYWSAKRDKLKNLRAGMIMTWLLGIVFLVGQVMAWQDLVDHGVYLVGNPSGSFLYILTGLHGFHIISALIFLLIVLVSTDYVTVPYKKLDRMEICTTYWHFLSALWLYLLVFLLFVGS